MLHELLRKGCDNVVSQPIENCLGMRRFNCTREAPRHFHNHVNERVCRDCTGERHFLPILAPDAGDPVVLADFHRHCRFDELRIGKLAGEIIQGCKSYFVTWGDEKGVVLRVGIRAADEPVEYVGFQEPLNVDIRIGETDIRMSPGFPQPGGGDVCSGAYS